MRIAPFVIIALAACSAADRGAPPGDRAGDYAGPIIDLHAHVFFDPDVAASVNPELVATPEGFERHVAHPRLAAAAAMVIAPRGERETREQNDRLLEFVRGSSAPLLPAGSVHPADGEAALRELARLAGEGVAMIKLHPNTQAFSVADPAVRAVVCEAGELGLPVVLDFSGALRTADVGEYIALAMGCPRTRLVLAHAGTARFPETLVLSVLGKYPWYPRNVWLEISVSASMFADSPYREQFVWVLRQIGMDRVLFGSDFPLYTTADAVAAVQRLGLTPEELRRVFHDNAAELLGLAGAAQDPDA